MKKKVHACRNHRDDNCQCPHDPAVADAAGEHNPQHDHHSNETGRKVWLFKYKHGRNGKKRCRQYHGRNLVYLLLIFHKIPGEGDDKANLYKFRGLELSQNRNLDPAFCIIDGSAPKQHGQKASDADQINDRAEIQYLMVIYQ